MSQTWSVISASYKRLPKKTQYKMMVKVDEVTAEGKDLSEKQLEIHVSEETGMEGIVTKIHNLLQKYPTAKVLMMPLPSVESQYGTELRVHELEQSFVDILRGDLDEAIKMFAPVERIVKVRPAPPRMEPSKEETEETIND
jgi:hypothetical protein